MLASLGNQLREARLALEPSAALLSDYLLNLAVGDILDATLGRISLSAMWGRFAASLGEPTDFREDLLSKMPDAVTISICAFLPPKGVAALLQTSRHFESTLSPWRRNASLVWSPLWSSFPGVANHEEFLTEMLQYLRDEYNHWSAIQSLASALKYAHVTLVSGNVGRFPSRRIAKAVTRRRPQALVGAIVENAEIGKVFRSSTSFSSSVSFMVNKSGSIIERPLIFAPGFVGYAIDLLELRPEEEYLRERALASFVYRDLTVWESLTAMQSARSTGLYAGDFYCVLDDPRNEIDITEDDAPRSPDGVSQQFPPKLSLLCAPYREFRPDLSRIGSVPRFIDSIRERIRSIEMALLSNLC